MVGPPKVLYIAGWILTATAINKFVTRHHTLQFNELGNLFKVRKVETKRTVN
jgi:hypothetical protein